VTNQIKKIKAIQDFISFNFKSYWIGDPLEVVPPYLRTLKMAD